MLVSVLSWIYIGAFNLAAGIAVRGILGRFFLIEREPGRMSITGTAVYGLIGITVYAEIYSIFDGVGAVCHLLLLAAVVIYHAASGWARRVLLSFLRRLKSLWFSWEGFFLLIFIFVVAFFTSRGTFHTDTGIYHAQAIRIIEEYGVVKGIANLQLHFGYNSSYLVFCAFFTMRWLTGTALHTTTGFLFALLGGCAFHGLWQFPRHQHHGADFMKIAVLIYILTNLYYAMSPATDYGTIIVALYLIAVFLETVENRPKRGSSYLTEPCSRVLCGCIREEKSAKAVSPMRSASDAAASDDDYDDKASALSSYLTTLGMIAIGGLFVVSMKLSAATIFLLAVYPLVKFLRQGQWKTVLGFVGLGVIVFLPFLVRNVILSGWLFYPVGSIDLFDVEWKVPLAYLENDAAQIKVWGRCLYDVDLVDMPISEWLPIWWEEQQHYAQMLIYADILSVPLFVCDLFLAGYRKKRGGEGVRWEVVSVVIMMYAGLAMWFFTAPFVRYGLAFILGLPLLACGLLAENCLSVYGRAGAAVRADAEGNFSKPAYGCTEAARATVPAESESLVYGQGAGTKAVSKVNTYVPAQSPGEAERAGLSEHSSDSDHAADSGRSGLSDRSGFSDRSGLWRIGGLWLAGLTAVCFCSWIDNYAMDCFVFIKQNLTDPYYITQKPFDDPEMGEAELADGVTVYYTVEGELNSYYTYPSTCYQSMLERTELIGDTIEEGFKAK